MLDSETNSLLQIENSRSYYFAINAATFCCSIRLLLNLPDHACLVVLFSYFGVHRLFCTRH
ncbi:Glutathione synthetase chloroplastic [Zea mays]|nr:Glutathione synthetase chloroplastic [Zea mays]